MPTFNREQTTFTLSMLSNISHCLTGSVPDMEAIVQGEIIEILPQLEPEIGTWTLVWGPAIVSLPGSDKADNTMFVAKNTEGSTPQLTIAIAGTNPYSALDWIIEDFLVHHQVPWFYDGLPAGREISLSTFIGLSALQDVRPSPGIVGADTTLLEYLQGQTGSPLSLAITGHSLGGALSPTVALWLSDIRDQWDPSKNASFYVLPTAGPTAGNQAFAAYSDSQLGAVTTRVHNAIDVVPHAWMTSQLEEVPTLYAPDIPESDLVALLTDGAIAASKDGNYWQISLAAPPLPGQVNTSIINPNASDFINFLQQLGYQHVDAYFELLGVTSIQSIVSCVKAAAALEGPQGAWATLEKNLRALQQLRASKAGKA